MDSTVLPNSMEMEPIIIDWHNLIFSEQALDVEARAKLPADFIVESKVANPPVFIYVMGKLIANEKVEMFEQIMEPIIVDWHT